MDQALNKKYFIETYGCQMNVHESEKIAGLLISMGYTPTETKENSDVIIYNTCCVREHAEVRVHGNVGALKALKDKNPDLKIIICGCMMQQEGVAEQIMKRFPYVDICIGTTSLHLLPELLTKSLYGERLIEVNDESSEIEEDTPMDRAKGISATITIIYGCNNYCAYCIVPYVRGRERSRDPEAIIKEAKSLAEMGYKEIMLLGQNVNSYGNDKPDCIKFAELLRRINTIDGIERIKFMTSHPKDLSEELIDAIAECKHVSKQLHLPVQSGSNAVLDRMNRKYTREHYMDLVNKLKSKVPDLGLSTDVIVGFPGETEEDFLDTLDLFEKVRFQAAYTFKYSKRKGTSAASLPDQIPTDIKEERLARLIEVQKRITDEHNSAYIGKIVRVLPETVSRKTDKMLAGRTDSGKIVHFHGDTSLIGKLQNVKITEKRTNVLIGELA